MDRRSSPPPHGDERRPAPGPDRFRRERSRSPAYRRSPKRFRREDDFQEERYGRRAPPPLRHRDPHHQMTFREFMATLPNDITPEDAKLEYDRYLASMRGNDAQADFDHRKNDPAVRRRFDPRHIAEAVDARNAASRDAAATFVPSTEPDALAGPPGPPPSAEAPTSGQEPARPWAPPSDQEGPKAPAVCWEVGVVATDLRVARQLVRTLDAERGVEINALAPPLAPAPENGLEGAPEGQGEGAPSLETRRKEQEEADAAADEHRSPEDRLAALDALLQYLWAVHGVDYYGGREFAGFDDPARTTARCTVRGPRPESGVPSGDAAAAVAAVAAAAPSSPEAPAAAPSANGTDAEGAASAPASAPASAGAEKEGPKEGGGGGGAGPDLAARALRAHEDLVRRWRSRIERGDPAEALLQRARVEQHISEFIDLQIIKFEDQKWGNRLSNKLFVDRKFVVKHIRNKHAHVLDAERNTILEKIFFENFKASREDERAHHGGGGSGGLGGFRGGRGGRGRGRGRGFGGPVMMDPSMLMGGPILVPAGGGMAPMIMAPMDMMMGMGMRGGRGGGRGGRGGRGFPGPPVVMAPAAGPQYFDLDAPRNNRAVLDYGDL